MTLLSDRLISASGIELAHWIDLDLDPTLDDVSDVDPSSEAERYAALLQPAAAAIVRH